MTPRGLSQICRTIFARLLVSVQARVSYLQQMMRKILIVDDEPDFSELVQYRLADCGYDFHTATNTADALHHAWNSPPDLIILDLLLPDLDGLSACEIFTRQPATHHIPIIMITALNSEVTRFSAQIAGVRKFFCKPVDFAALHLAIHDLLPVAAPTSLG